jgi:hypothetical protein
MILAFGLCRQIVMSILRDSCLQNFLGNPDGSAGIGRKRDVLVRCKQIAVAVRNAARGVVTSNPNPTFLRVVPFELHGPVPHFSPAGLYGHANARVHIEGVEVLLYRHAESLTHSKLPVRPHDDPQVGLGVGVQADLHPDIVAGAAPASGCALQHACSIV